MNQQNETEANRKGNASKLAVGVMTLAGAFLITSCGTQNAETKVPVSSENIVTNQSNTNRSIGDEALKYQVLSKDTLKANKAIVLSPSKEVNALLQSRASTVAADDQTVLPAPSDTATAAADSLVLGYPLTLLDENQVFGGVITEVSANASEALGGLKLTDLTPLHVRTRLAKVSESEYVLLLVGCASKCGEGATHVPLIGIPVLGVDTVKQTLLLDLSALGEELNLLAMLDPAGAFTQLKTKSAKTVSFDYSLSTLVFDIEVRMVPLSATDISTAPETVFKVRWYLRLASAFNPEFDARPATDGVGFFMTERSANPKIQRHSRYVVGGGLSGGNGIHYFVKNVPAEYKAAFKSGFDGWNTTFTKLNAGNLLTYEFVDATDPKAKLLVPGDVRYNIVEWDLVNQAPYGGLGPSIANQMTGEILSSNVLVQGPTIVRLYKTWFGVNTQANDLQDAGRVMEATQLLAVTREALQAQVPTRKAKFELSLGKNLQFRVPAQMPGYEDPAFSEASFEELPAGLTYETYMKGYFHELVGHELGHNVGLRHNFRGNLTSNDSGAVGSVSASIMEYLGRGYRHINDIGEYDVMAVKYGYLGVTPTKLGMFCTDENVVDSANLNNSAECSRDDATADPFGFFEGRLQRTVDLLIGRGTTAAPAYTSAGIDKEIQTALNGLALYAATAEKSGSKWTNFFNVGDRPTSVSEVKGYVVKKIRAKLCDPTIESVIAAKTTQEAKDKALANLKDLRFKTEAVTLTLNIITQSDDLKCN